MKSEHINSNKPKKDNKIKFPVLAMSRSGKVVLFNNNQSGTVVFVDDESDEDVVGKYFVGWVNVLDKLTWTILPSTEQIVLSNG